MAFSSALRAGAATTWRRSSTTQPLSTKALSSAAQPLSAKAPSSALQPLSTRSTSQLFSSQPLNTRGRSTPPQPLSTRGLSSTSQPHSAIEAKDSAERFTCSLFDSLWSQYRGRVEYVRTYEQVVSSAKATFFNDHIALRSLACQDPKSGIFNISRLFEALGYRSAECYNFEDKHLGAIYFQHPNPKLPKLFVSELRVHELSKEGREIVSSSLATYSDHVTNGLLADLYHLNDLPPSAHEALLKAAVGCMQADVEALHKESQYAAWVLLHGFNVNHFTALINSHGVAALDNIEKTADALKAAGVPMKQSIEGEPGSTLRQTATEAVQIATKMRSTGGTEIEVQWPYAYFELAQRDPYQTPDGKMGRYEGFFSQQATNLFEMTKH